MSSDEAPPASAGLDALHELERDLEAEWQRLQLEGHGATGLQALLDDDKDGERIAAAVEAQQHFLSRLDELLRRLHEHFVTQVTSELELAVSTMRAFYGRRSWRLRPIERQQRRLASLARRYAELAPLYGTPHDHRRIAVFQRFYAGVVDFGERIRALDPTMPRSAPRSLSERAFALWRGLARGVGRTRAGLRVGVAFLRVLLVLLARDREASLPSTPFTRRVDELFLALGDWRGLRVEVAGRLPDSGEGEAGVTIFAPCHRHGVTDNVTFSHLRLPDYLVFNAVDQLPGLPRFLKDRIAQTRGLIAVGGGRGPSVDRALEALGQGISHNVLVYPEGSVSEGFRGTRPPRANFGERLVRGIREAGIALRIVPVTYPENARFLDLPDRDDSEAARTRPVVLGTPIESDAIDRLLVAGGGSAVNQLLRVAWLESLPTDRERLFGQDRVRAIERRLDLELDGIRYWGSLESVPVRDVLSTESAAPAEVTEEPFYGKRVRVLRLPDDAIDDDRRVHLPELAGPESNELLIGLRDPSHIYLSVGRRRFDGDIFRPLQVKERGYVFPGIIVRLRGVPVKSLHALRRKLDEYAGREQRTLTCANSACRVIARAANIEIDDHKDLRPFLPSHVLPTRTMRKLIERGVRNHAGEPVSVQIYKTGDRPLEEMLAEARLREIQIARDHLEGGTRGAWRALRAWLGHRLGGSPRD